MATVFKESETAWFDRCISRGATEFFSIETLLTPALASEILQRNPANRSMLENRVELYASDIEAGRWQFNGEPIIISSDGLLTDGQHRCAAVIRAGRPIRTALAFGVDYDSRKTTNLGRAKTAGDFAGMDGVRNAQSAAAIAGMVLAYEATGGISKNRGITQAAILAYLTANRERICASASFAHSRTHRIKNIVAPSVLGFCHYLTSAINKDAADEYCDRLITGEGLSAGEPAFVVRNRLIAMGKASRAVKAELILHGWNAFRRGERRTMVKANGKLPEIV